jgi:polysaccharide biosynthesis transport protein
VTTRIEERLRSLRQEILSRTRLERIIQDFNLYADEVGVRPMEELVDRMRQNVTVDTVREDAFKVTFVARKPREAMIVADRLATMFIEENYRDRAVQADGTNQFLQTQLDDARTRLETHEQKLVQYRQRYAGELPSQLQGNLQVLQSTQSQIQNLTESINRDRDRRLVLEQTVTNPSENSDSGLMANDRAHALTAAIAAVNAARSELRDLQMRLTPEHPDVIAKLRLVADLEEKLRQAGTSTPVSGTSGAAGVDVIRGTRLQQYQLEIEKLDKQIATKETEMQRLRQVMSDYQRRVEAVPGHESELTALMRDYDTLQKLYADLLAKRENSNMAASLERQQVGEQFRILDPAVLPEEPFSPNRPRIALIAAALSLVLALGLIGLFEYRDSTLRTEDEIVRTLVLPVIAAIPVMQAPSDLRRRRRTKVLVALATVTTFTVMAAVLWTLAQ